MNRIVLVAEIERCALVSSPHFNPECVRTREQSNVKENRSVFLDLFHFIKTITGGFMIFFYPSL